MFDTNLLALPSKWEEAFGRIERAGIADDIRTLVELATRSYSRQAGGIDPSIEVAIIYNAKTSQNALTLVYAEGGEGNGFLATAPLRNLALDYRRLDPISCDCRGKGCRKNLYIF